MILPKIDAERFVELIRSVPLIAFQELEFGYAVAAPGEAYYAPMDHPGGGNLPLEFGDELGKAFIRRACRPALRTLRPTSKPIPNAALIAYLNTFGAIESSASFAKAAGDHPAVIEFQTQVVILAIEEHGRPDLRAAIGMVKLSVMSDALDLVVDHASSARELCEVGEEDKPMEIRLHLMQATQAMKTCLEMLLKP